MFSANIFCYRKVADLQMNVVKSCKKEGPKCKRIAFIRILALMAGQQFSELFACEYSIMLETHYNPQSWDSENNLNIFLS